MAGKGMLISDHGRMFIFNGKNWDEIGFVSHPYSYLQEEDLIL